ncbi:large-conductance mechanosensitive channel MscL [Mycoplasmoides gallisepticum CA06_2006.052-5-2P]|uniref:Large-conductance mechanosensitive channel MscL n=1 Tax=Mycoplasmoides gallisepticum WI01_2001.043-13-2P TaxID=1159201 RepID=J3T9C1_MYCGL|nr:MscL family protein [Mycoplasmoides gallisepticum]AFP76112.1 large-conductance mechanosensitive channel MscL [Mycoplasmoides gallisepticum VA94_7994-1-7P]AFP76879.1 large-conductance mechanosensitive channel MscL [Mycoplasmoides gallisepticum NC95_13295-2-2P]AFP77637.1 large-conductance mechanosensitive channel MscL [Mycoplasmoides gallisepticum NC96_1596-4-2P]AFP78404.1 large-conductance mechanosensitive channel MscL [Mycoplasmoides gallisepticum NY01_2001.047-5-1P]AFP79164.1 large-conduct
MKDLFNKDKQVSLSKNAMKNATQVVKRGNIFMLAIGLLLGTSFNAVIAALANDVIIAAIAKLYDVQDLQKWQVQGIFIGKFFAALLSFVIINVILVSALFVSYYIIEVRKAIKAKQLLAEGVNSTTTKLVEINKDEKIIELLEYNNMLLQQQIEIFGKAHNMKVEILSKKFSDSVISVPFDINKPEPQSVEAANLEKMLRPNAQNAVSTSNWSGTEGLIG